jgi:hypothetical protein
MRQLRLGWLQSWRRVLGELTLIVGGVLIALAVDSWREDYQERRQETAYLGQLLLDLRETDSRLKISMRGDSAMFDQVNWMIDRAFAGPLPPADSLDLSAGYTQFRPLTGTLVALIQSGDLRLVQSDSIRFQLIAYAALVDATHTLLRHTETLIWNSWERIILGRARHSRSADGGGATGWAQINVSTVLGDPDVISALQVQAGASQNRVRNLRRLEEPTAVLIRLLESELRVVGDRTQVGRDEP